MKLTAGTGPLYQGRFKSFPIQEDDHLLTVLRYVERNPLRANLVDEADAWRWSSLWDRTHRNRAGLVDAGPAVLKPTTTPIIDLDTIQIAKCYRKGRMDPSLSISPSWDCRRLPVVV